MAFLAMGPPSCADTVASFAGTGSLFYTYARGQSFTTTSTVPENHIALSFFTNQTATPFAAGNGFIFSQPFVGGPGQLGPASANFVGEGFSDGTAYIFDLTTVLLPNTQYFFYENAALPDTVLAGGNGYKGGTEYYPMNGNGNFTADPASSLDIRVTGTAAPEPSTWTLLGIGALGAGIVALRRRDCLPERRSSSPERAK